MKTLIKLTLATALAAGTFQAFAQDDALARLRAQRAQEQQQLDGQSAAAPAQTTDAAPAAEPAPADTTAPTQTTADDAASQDALTKLKAQRAAELSGSQPATATSPAQPAQPELDDQSPMETPAVAPDQNMDATASTSTSLSTNGITFNFRNAPLEQVLTYMSDAAGYTILLQAQVSSRVTVISTHPMTREKAVDVLNAVLNQNGLAAVEGDNLTLTIMTKDAAKTGNIPVKVNADPNLIPKNDEIVTQIIPIRFVDAQQLVVDISPFVSPQAIIIANQAGNSIIITDTQANIRHLAEIIKSIDSSAQTETSVQVFALKFANPNDVVTLLSGVFPGSSSSSTTRVGGGGNPFAQFFGRGGGGAGGGGAGGSSQARVQKAQQVLAVADGRTQSVVVTAATDMMPQIEKMIRQMDVPSSRDQDVAVLPVKNADPYQAAQVLQAMFSSSTARNAQTTISPIEQRKTTTLNTTTGGTTTGGTTGGRTGALY